jgi:hypothetical protein
MHHLRSRQYLVTEERDEQVDPVTSPHERKGSNRVDLVLRIRLRTIAINRLRLITSNSAGIRSISPLRSKMGCHLPFCRVE